MRDEAIKRVRDTRNMLKGREKEIFHIPPATALWLVYETLDKAEAALERCVPPEERQATYGDYLDAALMVATGSILSHYAAEKIRGYAREMLSKAIREPQRERT